MNVKLPFILIAISVLMIGCATNPFTGKKTMAFVSNASLFPSAFLQYDQFLKEHDVIVNTANSNDSSRW